MDPDTRARAPDPGHDAAPSASPVGATERTLAARRRQRRWVVGLWALGTAVTALAALTVVVSLPGTSGRPHGPTRAGRPGPSTTASSTSVAAPGAPVITSLTPAQASVGQAVAIAGTDLVSADGRVLAHFGDVVAPTACRSSTSCTATVPSPSSAAPQVQVTVTTEAGTSNALAFTYR